MLYGLILAAISNEAPSATRYYTEALETTRNVPKPATVSYMEHITSHGMRFLIAPSHGEAQFAIGYGRDMRTAQDVPVCFDAATHGVQLQFDKGSYRIRVAMFNATWYGIEDWLKYGFDGAPPDAPNAVAAPAPKPSPAATDGPQTIAVVSAVDPGAYTISDGGQVACSDGAPGHRLLLRALRDPDRHPLTSVVVDSGSMRFCTMDFRMGAPGALSLTGQFEVHFRAVGPYWLAHDGTADFEARALGTSAQHSHITFAYDNFVF